MQPTLIIMAAGVGSRFGGLKQLRSFGPDGATLLEYSIFDALRAGFERVVLIVRPETEKEFRTTLDPRVGDRVELRYTHQTLEDLPDGFTVPHGRTKPWGTGQAVLTTPSLIDGPFVVLNADDYYGPAAFEALARFFAETASTDPPTYGMVGYCLDDTLSDSGTVSRGVCRLTGDGFLESIQEFTAIARKGDGAVAVEDGEETRTFRGDEPVSMNIWAFTPAFFDELREGFRTFLTEKGTQEKSEYFLPEVVQQCIEGRRAKVRVLEVRSRWFGVTYPEDQARVEQALRALVDDGTYPAELWG